ncbi:asparagine synthase-related protein [Pengzhenrongella frigida]|uniref:asparagine synthase-related protein n=1 Tax=Pengzhenrongella frigida TaxID=1259133 RepID=UPI0013E9C647|nr:asparagine synthase-related protein [Cellulomonas sp. HLT2-17]
MASAPALRAVSPRPAPGEGFVRLDALETALAWPLGVCADARSTGPGLTPRAALEATALEALTAGRCFVTFSGGRDSSAVLAVAAQVARREGLPLPVPVTMTYPGIPAADESSWQTMVLEHLRITERIVVRADDDSSLLGPVAQASLARRGLLWPAALHLEDPVLALVRGGQVLTGEGGDEVLGARRVTPWTLLLREHRPPGRRLVRDLSRSALPSAAPWRRAVAPWLRGAARRAADARSVRRLERAPWHWGAATLALARRRPTVVLEHNLGVLAREHSVRVRHPLEEPRFLAALARAGGAWGYCGRTDLMRVLFGDLLPEPVLSRSTKASFSASRFGEIEREFVRSWDGAGLDPRLVRVDALRAHWLGERPSGAPALLLHAAWLAAAGIAREGAGS